jgi:membrane dipeptidase
VSSNNRKLLAVGVPFAIAAAVGAYLLANREVARAAAPTVAAAVALDAGTIHSRTLLLDAHVDILLPETPPQYRDDDGSSHASLAKLKAGGVDAVVLSLAVGPGPRDAAGFKAARAEVDAKYAKLQEFVAASGNAAVIAHTANEIEAAHKAGQIAIIPGFLNTRSLGKELGGIDEFYGKGVRVLALTHAGHNDWADSSRPTGAPPSEHGGLSPLGKQAIAKLNDLGIVVDISQLTPDGVRQVLEITRTPVIASHSGARALVDNSRNLSDAELDAIKANGGVVHVPPFNSYLRKLTPEIRASLAEVRGKYGLPREFGASTSPNDGYPALSKDKQAAFNAEVRTAVGRASVSDYVDHIEYIAKRIGVEHVGVGTDFDHGSGIVGFENEADAGNVTAELVKRGYSEADIQKIWSGNFLRVLRAAETARKV